MWSPDRVHRASQRLAVCTLVESSPAQPRVKPTRALIENHFTLTLVVVGKLSFVPDMTIDFDLPETIPIIAMFCNVNFKPPNAMSRP